MKRIIIAGSRNFNDYSFLCRKMDYLTSKLSIDEIIILSGTARGADQLGEKWAKERGIAIERHPADWYTHGKKAGYLRNAEMAKVGTHLVAFWDGVSKGTGHMINLARQHQLRTVVYTIK